MLVKITDDFNKNGFAKLSNAVGLTLIDDINLELSKIPVSAGSRKDIWGNKSIMESGSVIAEFVSRSMGKEYRVGWINYFDKRAERNWLVPPHRDEFLPVRDESWCVKKGFYDFTIKEGLKYAKAPRWIYDQIVAARLAIDKNDASNGPIQFFPGSHAVGAVMDDKLIQVLADPGDVVLMHPLIIHSSKKIANDQRRRVVHYNLIESILLDKIGFGLTSL
jgi:hypothetical protein